MGYLIILLGAIGLCREPLQVHERVILFDACVAGYAVRKSFCWFMRGLFVSSGTFLGFMRDLFHDLPWSGLYLSRTLLDSPVDYFVQRVLFGVYVWVLCFARVLQGVL